MVFNMKITRTTVMKILLGLGVLLFAFTIIRQITEFAEPQPWEGYVLNGIIIIGLVVYLLNRRMTREEKQAQKEKEEEQRREMEDSISQGKNNLPHWER